MAQLSEQEFSKMAHEFRNLLTSVKAEAQLAIFRFERSGDPEVMRKALDGVSEQVDNIVEILDKYSTH